MGQPPKKKKRKLKRNEKHKGLRHFSMKVCKKVEEKGLTTYNEVADELVAEFAARRKKEEADAKAAGIVLSEKERKKKKSKYV